MWASLNEPLQRRAPVAAGAEGDLLFGVGRVGAALIVGLISRSTSTRTEAGAGLPASGCGICPGLYVFPGSLLQSTNRFRVAGWHWGQKQASPSPTRTSRMVV